MISLYRHNIPSATKQTRLEPKQPDFTVEPLSKNSRQILVNKGIWKPACPVALERLNKVKFSYYNFQNTEQNTGEIVVLDTVAGHVADIFKDLHARRFPIKTEKCFLNFILKVLNYWIIFLHRITSLFRFIKKMQTTS